MDVEFYMIDEELNNIFNAVNILLKNVVFICLDVETAVLFTKNELNILINPKIGLNENIKNLRNSNDEISKDNPSFIRACPQIKKLIRDAIIVKNNTIFDILFLNRGLERININSIKNPVIDTLSFSRDWFSDYKSHNVNVLSKRLNIDLYDSNKVHWVMSDTILLIQVLITSINNILIKNNHGLKDDSLC